MPYYLGKNTRSPLSRNLIGKDLASINELYKGYDQTPTTTSSLGRTIPVIGDVTPYTPGVAAPTVATERVSGEQAIARPEEAEVGGGSYVDELMSAIFGEGFENIRGVGGRSREAVYDTLAREGLLGTGASQDVAKEMAWQTERGITDLTRDMTQMRADKEAEAMNMIMTWLGMNMQSWK